MKRNSFLQLGEYLKKKREACGLSQAKAADIFGYSCAQFISNWERGESAPPEEVLPNLTLVYKIKPKELSKILLKIHKTHLEEVLGT